MSGYFYRVGAALFAAAALCGAGCANTPVRKAVFAGGDNPQLFREIVEFSGKSSPRVLVFCAPCSDSPQAFEHARAGFSGIAVVNEAHLLSPEVSTDALRQMILDCDIIWVCGGSTELLTDAVAARGLAPALREAYARGVVAAGYSAGAICWSFAGYNDFSDGRYDLIRGVGVIPVLYCPHYQGGCWTGFDRQLECELDSGLPREAWALTDGASLFFTDETPELRLSSPDAKAYRFLRAADGWRREEVIPPRR